MQLKIFRHLWGVDLSWEEAFPKFQAAGYCGIETGAPSADQEQRFNDLRRQYGLDLICLAQTSGRSAQEHLADLRKYAERAQQVGARFVNVHAGLDSFDRADRKTLFGESLRIEADLGISISHETHRGRPLYNPWTTAEVLSEFPSLKVTSDLSHWVCVAERMIDDCMPIIKQVAEQTFHIHARVGFAEGPQVPDPRAPEYQNEVESHERWWDLMWESQRRRGLAESTLCPEYGPPGYLHALPYTKVPVANLWEIVDWQADREKQRFAKQSA